MIVFLDWFQDVLGLIARGHWLFLLLLWAAFRFGLHGVLFLLITTALSALWGAEQHKGFFGNDLQLTGLQNFWCYQWVITLVGLLLVLSLQARRQIEQQLLARTEELDAYFDNALDLFAIADRDGFFHTLNFRWRQVLGYELAVLKSKPFLDFVHPDDIPITLNAMANLASHKTVSNFVNRYRHRDGSWRWIQWNSYTKGALIYAAARDITEQKNIEDELRLAALVYQNSSEAMMITDANNRIISINPAFTVCTGYMPADVLGENPRILSSGRQAPEFYVDMWKALNTVGRWKGEIYNRRKNSDIYVEWAVINLNPCSSPDNCI
jgi:PAS domain S-box-containing protein